MYLGCFSSNKLKYEPEIPAAALVRSLAIEVILDVTSLDGSLGVNFITSLALSVAESTSLK